MPRDCPPYSFDTKIVPSGASARIRIPYCVSVSVGDTITIWVGEPENFYEGDCINGRGRNQEERSKYLEEKENILRRCAGQQIHNERNA